MILELADIRIKSGQQAAFEAAVQHGIATVVSTSPGFISYTMQHGIESPERYVLLLQWDTLEAHSVTFRESALFPQWRAIVGPFFAGPPVVEHFNRVG